MAEPSPDDLVHRLRTLAESAADSAGALPELLRPVLQQLVTELRETVDATVAEARDDLAAVLTRALASTEAAQEGYAARTLEHLAEVRGGIRHLETTLTQRTEALAEESIRLTEASERSSTEAAAAQQETVSLLDRTRQAAVGIDEASNAVLQRLEQVAAEAVSSMRAQVTSLLADVEDRFRASESEAAARLENSGRALHADLLVGVSDLRDRLREVLDERDHRDELLERRLDARVERLTTKTVDRVTAAAAGLDEALARGSTALQDQLIDVTARLEQTVHDRDHRDELREKRLEARVERFTKRTADRINDMVGALDDRLADLRDREVSDRAHVTSTLREIVDRVLAEPRSTLRGLRKNLRDD